ncbi:MAG: hypothetical protein ABUT39_15285 [Acidobacteriota bacterium]
MLEEEEDMDDQAAIPATATVTRQEATQILREIAEADKDDDWAEYVSWQ